MLSAFPSPILARILQHEEIDSILDMKRASRAIYHRIHSESFWRELALLRMIQIDSSITDFPRFLLHKERKHRLYILNDLVIVSPCFDRRLLDKMHADWNLGVRLEDRVDPKS